MSYSFSLNRDQVITGALRTAGVIGQGETPNATQISEASDAFNILVKNLETTGLPLWAIRQKVMTYIGGQVAYITDAAPLSMTDKPMKIVNAYTHDTLSNTDIPVTLITRDEYIRLGNKASTGVPVQLWYDPQKTNGTLTVYPSPDANSVANKQLIFWYQGQFADMTANTDIPDFPTEWIRPLKWLLAADLCEEYGVPTQKKQYIEAKAKMLLEEVLGYGQEEGSVFFSRDSTGWGSK